MEYNATWAAMEGMVAAKTVRAIGVSNFTKEQLADLEANAATIKRPAVNQVEVHPYLGNSELLAYCADNGIRVMGYSPLGSANDRHPEGQTTTLLNHPEIAEVAAAAGKTPAQVLIKWGLQRAAGKANFISIPKSTNAGGPWPMRNAAPYRPHLSHLLSAAVRLV